MDYQDLCRQLIEKGGLQPGKTVDFTNYIVQASGKSMNEVTRDWQTIENAAKTVLRTKGIRNFHFIDNDQGHIMGYIA